MNNAYNDPEYKRARTRILAEQPPCALCGKPGADTIDHVVPLMNGGTNSPDNYRPAHRACNSAAGARARNANTAAKNHARNEALREHGLNGVNQPEIFYTDRPKTPSQVDRISERNRPEPVGIGRDRPRLETDWSDAAGTLGSEVGAFAETWLGVTLMPWQRHVLNGLFAVDGDGRWQHRIGLFSVARQNGKSLLGAAAVGWLLCEWPKRLKRPVTVLTTAHRLDVAVELFYRLADILESAFGAKVSRAYGRNEIRMPDGSRWLVKAATGSVGHGLSCDAVLVDEVFGVSPEAIDAGLMPTIRARPNPLFLMFSTAGTEDSTVFLRYREQGLRAIDSGKSGRLYFAEFSPGPELDPMSPAAWEYANPALGHTLEMRTLEAEAESPDRAAFLRASVNLWVASDRGWIPPGLWPELRVDDALPAGGVVAVETSLDESRYFAVRSVVLPDGRVASTVEFHVDTLTECLAEISRLGQDARNRFAVSPSIDLHFPRQLEQRKSIVGYAELLKWTAPVRALIDQRRVAHTGETMLAEHVQRAVAVRAQNGIALSSQRSSGPIELARCLVWSVAMVSRPAAYGKPMIVVAGG